MVADRTKRLPEDMASDADTTPVRSRQKSPRLSGRAGATGECKSKAWANQLYRRSFTGRAARQLQNAKESLLGNLRIRAFGTEKAIVR